MNIDNINIINELNSNLTNSDNLHILRDYKEILLSYKGKSILLTDIFESLSNIKNIQSKLSSIEISANAFFDKFITKSEVDEMFTSKTVMNNITPSLLTYAEMDNLLSKYVNENNLIEKGADAAQEAIRLADEMTDFAGAAVVGINQSGGGGGEETSQGEGEGEE